MMKFQCDIVVCFIIFLLYCDTALGHRGRTETVQRCKEINDFWGGQVVYFGDRKLYSQVHYLCNDGYIIYPKDDAYSLCEKNETNKKALIWVRKKPQCLKKATIEVPNNGYSRPEKKTEFLHNESYRVYCNIGYEFYSDGYMEGTHQMTITNNNGTLEPKVPECREERCDPIQQRNALVRYVNGSDVTTNIISGTAVYLSCRNGYKYYDGDNVLNSPLKRTCIKGKIIEAPTCQKVLRCPNVPTPEHGQRIDSNNGAGDYTEFTCDIGYKIKGRSKLLCRTDGNWLPSTPPICDLPKCEDINDFWGGQVVFFGDKQLYSQVYYICNDGYTMFPKDVAYSECEKTLQWKPRQPKCLKKATKEVPKNGYSPERKTELLHNETYRVFCRRDYEFYSDGYLEGIHQMTITNNNGTLEPKVPECREGTVFIQLN